jgi:hypothetical protein
MKKMYLLIVVASVAVASSFAMELVPSSSWHPLSHDLTIRIMACCDQQSQGKLRATCHELSRITTQNIMLHPLSVLTRSDHIRLMVHTAKADIDEEVKKSLMKKLIDHADNCDHEDVLDWMPMFCKDYSSPVDTELALGRQHWIAAVCTEVAINIGQCRQQYAAHVKTILPLIISFYRGDKEIGERYILSMMDNDSIKIMNTPMHLAAARGNVAMAELLIIQDAGAINTKAPDCSTPLHVAAGNGHNNIVKMILERDSSNVDVKNGMGYTALMYAAKGGSADIVNLLLGYEVDVALKNNDGMTALDLAEDKKIQEALRDYVMGSWNYWDVGLMLGHFFC